MNLFVFNIKTIPDIEGGRRLYNLAGLTDKEVTNVMFHKRRQETGTEFLRLHLQKIISISGILRTEEDLAVWSLGGQDANEKEMIEEFFEVIEKYSPEIISWDGKRFDLPVLHYRSLVHGVQASEYWSTVDDEHKLPQNNTTNRYLQRHTNLVDTLAGHEMTANAPLHEIASLLGLPGKVQMSTATAWDYFRAGNINEIRNSCETEVLNTYLIYLRYQFIRGNLTNEGYKTGCDHVTHTLTKINKNHISDYLNAWQR